MNTHQFEELCRRFRLGAPVAMPQPVTSGSSHQLWRMETPQGTYAVKQISAQHVTSAALRAAYQCSRADCGSDGGGRYSRSARLDPPKPSSADHWSALGRRLPWVEGQTLLPGSASLKQMQHMGTLLGQMHALAVPLAGLDLPTWRVWRDDDWVLLARRVTAAQVPWAETVRAALPDLCWWSRLARDASPGCGRRSSSAIAL